MCTAAGNCSTGLGLGSACRDRKETGLLALLTPSVIFSLKTTGHPRAQEQMSVWRTPTKGSHADGFHLPGCKCRKADFPFCPCRYKQTHSELHGVGCFPSPARGCMRLSG